RAVAQPCFEQHSPPLQGGVAARSIKRSRSSARADGVVSKFKQRICSKFLTTPSAPQRWLRDILLMSRPPLLVEEGNVAQINFAFHVGQQPLIDRAFRRSAITWTDS